MSAMILGTGRAVPEKVLTNADLEKMVDTSDRWIVERTGIRQRHIADAGAPLSGLAAEAAITALADAGVEATEIDLIVMGTVSGDMQTPSTACLVQEKIGAKNAFAFDLSAACSGFLYGLQVGASLMGSAGYSKVLVIGGELPSTFINWQDRDTCILFGDGAGAVVLGPSEEGRGLLRTCLKSDGGFRDSLYVPGFGYMNPPTPENVQQQSNAVRMEGRDVFRHAVTKMSGAMQQVLDGAGLTPSDLDLFIPHQANLRIIEAVGKKLDITPEKVFVNVDRYGNTSAASIPIALDEARKSGRAAPGDLIGMVAFGAGFTWAAGLLRL